MKKPFLYDIFIGANFEPKTAAPDVSESGGALVRHEFILRAG